MTTLKKNKLISLTIIFFAISLSCMSVNQTQSGRADSLIYYKLTYNFIEESPELRQYGERNQILMSNNELCVGSNLLNPARGYFLEAYIDYVFSGNSDSIKKIKRDSLLIYDSRYINQKNDSINFEISTIAKKDNCKLQIFFREFRENYLSAEIFIVQKYENNFLKFQNLDNTHLSYFFIFENKKIAMVSIKEFIQ